MSNNKLNEFKNSISDLYIEQYKDNKFSIYQYDLGTGSGKTYNYFNTFANLIQKYKNENNIKNKTLSLYMAPFKSHLEGNINNEIDENTYGCIMYASSDFEPINVNNLVEWYENSQIFLEKIKNEMCFKGSNVLLKYGKELFSSEYTSFQKSFLIDFEKFNLLISKINDIEKSYNSLSKKNDQSEFEEASFIFQNKIDIYKNSIKYYYSYIRSHFDKNKTIFLEILKNKEHKFYLEVKYLVNILSIFDPYYLLEIYDHVYIIMTNKKSFKSQSFYNKIKGRDYYQNSSFIGGNIFEILAETSSSNKKVNFLNNIYKDLHINVFIDESDEYFYNLLEDLINEKSYKFNIPQFISSFVTEYFLTSYSDPNYIKLYNFIDEKGTQGIIKNTDVAKMIRAFIKGDKTNSQGLKINNLIKNSKNDKKLLEIVKIIENKMEDNISQNNILVASKIFNTIKEKLKFIDVDFKTFEKILEIHQNNIKDFYINRDLYELYKNEVKSIFYKQDYTISFSNKDSLKELFVVLEKKTNTNLKLTNEKPKKDVITLYDYLAVTFLFLNILKSKLIEVVNDDLNTNKENGNYNATHNLLDIKNIVSKEEFKILNIDTIKKELEKNNELFKLNEDFLYKENKFIIKLNNSNSYQKTTNSRVINLSLEIHLGITSPEELIMLPIKKESCNKYNLFLCSATGGWKEDILSQFNLNYILSESNKNNFLTNLNENSENYTKLENKILELNKLRIENKDIKVSILENKFKDNKNLINEFLQLIKKSNITNKYKIKEINNFINSLYYLVNSSNDGLIGFTQTTKFIKTILLDEIYNNIISLNKSNLSIQFKINHEYLTANNYKKFEFNNNLIVDCEYNDYTITIIFFKSKIDTEYNNLGYDFKKDFLTLKNDKHKIFVISDYTNILKGLNFKISKNNKDKDFDSLVFLIDKYYEKFDKKTMIKDNMLETINKIKYIVKESINDYNLNNLYKLNQDINYKKFINKMNNISFTKDIIQGLGRIERTDNNKELNIIICYDTFKRMLLAYKQIEENNYTKHQLERVSPNNTTVYDFYKSEKNKYLFSNNEKYQNYIDIAKKLDNKFVKDINLILKEIDDMKKNKKININLIEKWDALRDKLMFIDFNKYLKELKKYFDEDFIQTISYLNKELKEFIDIDDLNKLNYLNKDWILSDLSDANINYDMFKFLRMSNINYNCTEIVDDFLKKASFDLFNGLDKLNQIKLPYPFLQSIVSATILENLIKEYLIYFKNDFYNDFIIHDNSFYNKNPEFYELFDFYLEDKDNKTLYCIDAKNWSKNFNELEKIKNDGNLKKTTFEKLINKKTIIEKKYKNVRYIYVNLIDDGEQHKIEPEFESCFLFKSVKNKITNEYEIDLNEELKHLINFGR